MDENKLQSNSTSPDPEMNFDKLADELGGMGRYQIFIYILICICSFLSGTTAVIIVFTAYINPHRCFIPECDQENSSYEEAYINFSIPYEYNNMHKSYNSCYSYDYTTEDRLCSANSFDKQKVAKCADFIFDTKTMTSTFVTTFQLVCDKAYLVPIGGSLYMAGNLFGSPAMGFIFDKFGRKRGLLISTLLFSLGGVASAFSPYYEMFLLFIFITGIGAIGCFHGVFVIGVEFIGTNWRTFSGIMIMIPFALGEASAGIIAYILRDWKWLLFTCTAPVLLMVSYQWCFPESIRWLMSKNRVEDAERLVNDVAKINKIASPSYLLKNIAENEECNRRNQGYKNSDAWGSLTIFKYPNMRKRSIILFFCWCVCSLTYYGLSANSGNLSGNLFLNYILLMLIEVPAYITVYFFLQRIGRKETMMTIFLLAGIASLISGILPSDLKIYIVILSLLGKFGIAAAFGTLFVYTAELYPTEYRGIGLGACSAVARIGSILAPIVASLSRIYLPLPLLIFGTLSFVAGLLILFLPETFGSDLLQTLEESERFGRDQPICPYVCCLLRKKSKLTEANYKTEESGQEPNVS